MLAISSVQVFAEVERYRQAYCQLRCECRCLVRELMSSGADSTGADSTSTLIKRSPRTHAETFRKTQVMRY